MLGPGGYERGFHNTGLAGIFGAITALCKLRNHGANTVENAFGLALTYSSGTMQWLENGSWNKKLNTGNAAFNAFNCLAFAEAGVLGAAKAMEGNFDWEDGATEELVLENPLLEGNRMPTYECIKHKYINVSHILGPKKTERIAG